ncbi:ParA family protein [bacterium]|nr:ParA family protein [bacterium]
MDKKSTCITFANHKGGVGKTTSCLNVSGYLAKAGKKVLIVDFDPQGNATSGLGIDKNNVETSMYDIMTGDTDMRSIILETEAGIHLAPATIDLVGAESELYRTQDRASVLKNILGEVRGYYDYIMIDTPPGSRLFTINGVAASDYVIVPLDAGIFAFEGLETLDMMFDDIRENVNVKVSVKMALLTNCIKPSIFSRVMGKVDPVKEIEVEARKIFKKAFSIPHSVEIFEAHRNGLPISHYAPRCKAGLVYQKIAEEVMRL